MVFHRAKHKHMDVKLCINKVPIQQVDNTNFLGVIINVQITLVKSHILHQLKNNKRNWYYL